MQGKHSSRSRDRQDSPLTVAEPITPSSRPGVTALNYRYSCPEEDIMSVYLRQAASSSPAHMLNVLTLHCGVRH